MVGSGSVVCADSAFASVRSAVHLHRKGLYFLGLVKTASRCFPKEFLESYPLQGRGDHVAVTSKMDGVNLIGCAWNDNKRKLIVGTCGTTLPGNPHEKKRWRVNQAGQVETYYKQVKRPKIVELYFSGAPAVDIHNHYRQGGLGLERSFQTQVWWMRVFCTILGMIETDAYVAYIRFHRGAHDMTHRGFAMQLATALANSHGATTARELRQRAQPTLDVLPFSPSAPTGHVLKPLIHCDRFESRRGTNNRAKLTCNICKRRASYYCGPCNEATNVVIPICGSGSERDCFVQHVRNCAPCDY